MKITINDLATAIGGAVIGDGTLEISGVSSFDDAGADEITFAVDPKFLNRLNESGAGAVIVPRDFPDADSGNLNCTLVKSDNPKLHFFRIVSKFHPAKTPDRTISPMASMGGNLILGKDVSLAPNVTVGDNVTLGDRVCLMPGVYVGDNVVIGSDTIIKPNVTVMEKTRIGNRVLIHSGTVIGSDGFGFTPNQGGHEKLIHAGFVQIDDDVEIGACNTIDRGTLGRTWIGRGVKTDNLVHIAHNVTIGENSLIVAQVGIAGSAAIGRNVILAGKSAVSGHLTVGDGAIVGPGSGVLASVPPGEIVSGLPSMPHKIWLKVGRIIPRLPDFRKRLSALEKRVDRQEADKRD